VADRITSIIPSPRRVDIGGATFHVWPATLYDLAELQGWLDDSEPDVLSEVWPQLFGDDALEGEPRWALLRDAHARADLGPPAWDDDRGADMLATSEGVATLVWLSLRKGHPELKPADSVALSLGMSAAEYLAVRRAWLGAEPAHEIARLLMEGFPQSKPGEPATWGKVVHETAEAFGWTYPQVYALTLAEFANARRGGEPADTPGAAIKTGDTAMLKAARERAKGPTAADKPSL
jgi:hypothetical protein